MILRDSSCVALIPLHRSQKRSCDVSMNFNGYIGSSKLINDPWSSSIPSSEMQGPISFNGHPVLAQLFTQNRSNNNGSVLTVHPLLRATLGINPICSPSSSFPIQKLEVVSKGVLGKLFGPRETEYSPQKNAWQGETLGWFGCIRNTGASSNNQIACLIFFSRNQLLLIN